MRITYAGAMKVASVSKETPNSSFSLFFWIALIIGSIGLLGMIAVGAGIF
jgi:hypothetical protein